MKKRLLITSIVMMLVVAVALSTATYAWFTSNTSVKADTVLLTASTMTGDAILISHEANNTQLSSAITLTSAGDLKLYPATPNAEDALTAATAAKFINLQVDGTNNAKKQTIASPNASYYTDTFYVYNKGYQPVTLDPTVNIYFNNAIGSSSDAAKSVRIAVIESIGTEVTTGNVTFGSPVLKNIYEYDVTDGKTTEVAVTTYKVATEYDGEATYYTFDGSTYSVEEVADEGAFDAATVGSLYIVEATTTHKNVAVAGALSYYGADTEDSEPSASSVYEQDEIAYTSAAYQPIAAPHSNYYVANKYTVVVWLEGWDTECTNAMSAGLFRIDLSFVKASA